MLGSAIGGGIGGLVGAAIVSGSENEDHARRARSACLAKKGYKLVPKS
jgi:hypothetical protein